MADRSAGGLGTIVGFDITTDGPFETYNVHKTRAYRKNRQSRLANVDAQPLFRPRSSCSTRRIKDPRTALYNPGRFKTSYYLEDPPEIPAVAGKEQWKRLSSKWNQKYNLPASSRQKRRPQSSHASHRGEEPHYPHSDYHMGTTYTPQSSGRWNEGGRSQRSQSSQRSQRPTWREEASAKRQQPAPALVSHLSTERSNKKTPTEKERFFRSIESENWQVTPDIIKENLECDRLLRTASWEAQAAETALTMQRFVESDQHMRRANKLQEAAESLSDELFSRSKTRYPGMTTMKHDYTIREPLLHAGGYSRPFNADCLDPMKTML